MRVMFQVLALLGKMGVSGAYAFIFVFFTELIPTVVRNMGFGVASTAGRIGTIICPYVIYMGKCCFFVVLSVFISHYSVTVNQYEQYQDAETEAAKWNSAIFKFIIYTCAFPTVKCQTGNKQIGAFYSVCRCVQ